MGEGTDGWPTGKMPGCANQDLQVYDKRGGTMRTGETQRWIMDGNATLLITPHFLHYLKKTFYNNIIKDSFLLIP